MYAVIRTKGKQFKVQSGDELFIPTTEGEVGSKLNFDEVLAVGDGEKLTVGKPTVEGASVSGTIVGHGRGRKILLWKHLRRHNSKTKRGHRQGYTQVRIDEVKG